MNEKTCAVIVPHLEPYESRYQKFYKPTLESFDLIVKRLNPTVMSIDEMKDIASDATLWLADISGNTLQPWYKGGYINARGKDIILLREKTESYVFEQDIHHYEATVDSDENSRNYFKEMISECIKMRMKQAEYDAVCSEREFSKGCLFIPLDSEYVVIASRTLSTTH